MNAILSGILLGATMLVALFSLEGESKFVMLACLLVAFVGGIVGAAYSNWEIRDRG